MEILAPAPKTRLRDLSQLQSLAVICHPSLLADLDFYDVLPLSFLLINKLYSTVDLSPFCHLRHFVGIPSLREGKQGIKKFPCVYALILQRSRFQLISRLNPLIPSRPPYENTSPLAITIVEKNQPLTTNSLCRLSEPKSLTGKTQGIRSPLTQNSHLRYYFYTLYP